MNIAISELKTKRGQFLLPKRNNENLINFYGGTGNTLKIGRTSGYLKYPVPASFTGIRPNIWPSNLAPVSDRIQDFKKGRIIRLDILPTGYFALRRAVLRIRDDFIPDPGSG
jgi:hypothetical protein